MQKINQYKVFDCTLQKYSKGGMQCHKNTDNLNWSKSKGKIWTSKAGIMLHLSQYADIQNQLVFIPESWVVIHSYVDDRGILCEDHFNAKEFYLKKKK